VKYSFENLLFTKTRRRAKAKPVNSSPRQDRDNELEDEAVQLINALMSSPYPVENDEISGFYSEVRQQSEQGVGSASEWFDQITSNK
jgi:hypothetical protein